MPIIAVNAELLLSSFIAYLLIRPMNNNIAMVVLGSTLLYWFIVVLYQARWHLILVPLFLFGIIYFVISFDALRNGNFDFWRYCLFGAAIYFLMAIKHNMLTSKKSIFLVMLLILLLFCFYSLGHPPEIEEEVFQAMQYNIGPLDPRGISRTRYIFKHSNEAGLFFASIFGYISFKVRVEEASRDIGEFLYLVLGAVVFLLASTTMSFSAIFTMTLFICLRWVRGSVPALRGIVVAVVIIYALSQAFFSLGIMDYLETGSLYWRFWCADQVVHNSHAFNFDSENLGFCYSWNHSLLLDLLGTVGYAIGGAVFLIFFAWSVWARDSILVIAANSLVAAALLQPVGALAASFLALVVAWTAILGMLENSGQEISPHYAAQASQITGL